MPSLTCAVDTAKFASGACNVVVALTFSDANQWVVRIQLPRDDDADGAGISTAILSEVSTMELIRLKTTIPVPRVFGYDASAKSIGYRYMMMEALPGQVLDSRMALSVPDVHKEKFAAQLAGHFYELSKIRFDRIGRVLRSDESSQFELSPFDLAGFSTQIEPLSTSLEFFYYLRKGQTNAILKAHQGEPEWEAAAWLLEQSAPMMTTEENIRGPFPLCHIDFHYHNVLVDQDYNITGLLDWSNAQTVPIERFAIIPEFVAPPAAPVESKEAIGRFRQMFVDALQRVHIEKDGLPSVSSTILSRLFASPRSDLVVRCTYSFPWRAIFDARLALPLMYGQSVQWAAFQKYHAERGIRD
ncbi:unnamed protein product [Penicillium olsonii]|nr:unnamed protein product [Penicillium olsonii]